MARAVPRNASSDAALQVERLRVTEIFYSLQGEARTVGFPTAFVRLTGCPLRCGYCDTTYAFHGGEWLTLEAILDRVADYSPRFVTVTGGEPLAQAGCRPLLTQLAERGYEVSLETSGALDIADIDARVSVVMDLKTPGSGECERNRYQNIVQLRAHDQVKFVIADRSDYDWSVNQVRTHSLLTRCEVLYSPVHGVLDPAQLAAWMLQDRLPVRMQVQLHKLLWHGAPGR